jgi:hypothetical protein
MTTEDRLGALRQQLSECSKHLAETEAIAINAVIEGNERDVSGIETRKAQARERIAVLGKAIAQLERQRQLEAEQFMTRASEAFIAPLVAPLDRATAALALPPHTGPMHDLMPETVKPKQTFRWPGMPREGSTRWNDRAR